MVPNSIIQKPPFRNNRELHTGPYIVPEFQWWTKLVRKKNVMADGYLKAEEITKVVEVTEVVDDLFVVGVNKVMDDTKKVEDTRVVAS